MLVKTSKNNFNRFTVEQRIEAVRRRLYLEISHADILSEYQISSSTLSDWMNKYSHEVLRREGKNGIPLYVTKTISNMKKVSKDSELERLRKENELLKSVNEVWEIIADLSKERYNIDLKKNFDQMQLAGSKKSTLANPKKEE